jgi:hypothetical protein
MLIIKPKEVENGNNDACNTKVCAATIGIDSVQENKLLFTDRQIARAKVARQLYHALGTPFTLNYEYY